jgi:hypothetical protein
LSLRLVSVIGSRLAGFGLSFSLLDRWVHMTFDD